MRWIKYRTMWAWGYNPHQGWYWMTIDGCPGPKDVRGIMERKGEELGGHSDKFRKIEWKTVRKPPIKVVEKEYARAVADEQEAQRRVTELALVRDAILRGIL